VSPDGEGWELQLRIEAPADQWGSLNAGRREMRYLRAGFWSRSAGLQRLALQPGLDGAAVQQAGDQLVRAVAAAQGELPFALADSLECWLLDRSGQPLALVASARPEDGPAGKRVLRWIAAALEERQLGQAPQGAPLADDLENLLRRTAQGGRIGWFRRERAGHGAGSPLDPAAGEPLAGDAFPCLPLRPDWALAADQSLVDAWVAWMAPGLLCLPYLTAQDYLRLQSLALQRAESVDRLWRLYPAAVDRAFIDRCRVEARLRRAPR